MGGGKSMWGGLPIILLAIIFLMGLCLRLEPFLFAPDLPYGLRDAALHYQIAKLVYDGRSLHNVYNILLYPVFKDEVYYPPLTHYVPAYLGRLVGDFQHTLYITNALFESLSIITIYLLAREIFGDYPALASSLFIALSTRDVEALYWGTWMITYATPFIPLTLYFAVKSLKDARNLVLCGLSAGICFLAYPQIAVYSYASGIAYILLRRGKNIRPMIRHFLYSAVVFILVSSPVLLSFDKLLRIASIDNKLTDSTFTDIILSWYPLDPGNNNYPPGWYDPIETYNYFGLLLPLTGFTVLYARRKDKRVHNAITLVLLLLCSFYLFSHIHQIITWASNRPLKYMAAEAYILALLAAAPFHSKINPQKYNRVFAAALLLGFVIIQSQLLFGYGIRVFPVGERITPGELKAIEWIRTSTGEKSSILYRGYAPMVNWGWASVLSERRFLTPNNGKYMFSGQETTLDQETYVYIDANMPYWLQNETVIKEEFGKLQDINNQLKDISILTYSTEEVIIRRLIPAAHT
jgi:4-amino-4-deoxy-L-arabinose transferase-like glycosyltransferase